LDRLWILTKSRELDRRERLNTINDVDRSLIAVILTLLHLIEDLTELPPQRYKGLMDAIGVLTLVVRDFYPSLSDLRYQLERPDLYNDDDVRTSIVDFCKRLEAIIMLVESSFGLELRRDLPLISELISRFPPFTESWAIATVYLSAMEVAVKRALRKRGMEVAREFRENIRNLINVLRGEGVEVQGLEELLPSTFWEVRNRVVHEGYSPSYEELKIIVEYVKKFIEKVERTV